MKCEAKIMVNYHLFPCSHNASMVHESKHYCGKHNPVKKAAKEEANRIAAEISLNKRRNEHHKIAMYDRLFETLEMLTNGLEWRSQNASGTIDESDYEALANAKSVLALAKRE